MIEATAVMDPTDEFRPSRRRRPRVLPVVVGVVALAVSAAAVSALTSRDAPDAGPPIDLLTVDASGIEPTPLSPLEVVPPPVRLRTETPPPPTTSTPPSSPPPTSVPTTVAVPDATPPVTDGSAVDPGPDGQVPGGDDDDDVGSLDVPDPDDIAEVEAPDPGDTDLGTDDGEGEGGSLQDSGESS